ncbi:glycosyltransferase [Bosea sp. 124]|uniref:glycosyltransferase n=1 Tax=Bosea sp. 124 TaxID=2135642 RepID=UPI000D461F46|nr:glycosyltransferase [Bosea sp. 124]PTM41740.1 glycosyltransferase involved in cell wall biosynthesis [Bosea sp. 124]
MAQTDPMLQAPGSLQIIASLSPEAGGPAYSVPRLAAALRPWSPSVRLMCLEGGVSGGDLEQADAPERHHRSTWPFLNQIGWSPALRQAISVEAVAPCILHTHGLWLMPNRYPAWARRKPQARCRLVHSPRGMLGAEALRISAWKKRPIWHLWQRGALAAADVIHATARSEYEEIRAAGLRNPVAIIPNGIDLPHPSAYRQGGGIVAGQDRTILSLGRIHPKKGLDRLIRAWASVQDQLPNWSLALVGPAELNHDTELLALAAQLGARRVTLSGPVYGDAKWQLYGSAALFVLPTLNENFGISVAEALACEVPVISTKGAPWSGLKAEDCGWWVDHGVEPLAKTLIEATTLDQSTRQAMGARGRAWMARDFGWDRIGRDMAEIYRWCFAGGPPPSTVELA